MKVKKAILICIFFNFIIMVSTKSDVYASDLNNNVISTSKGYTEIKAEVKEETTGVLSDESDNQESDADKPHTSDNSNIVVLLILLLTSLAVMISIKIYNIERKK